MDLTPEAIRAKGREAEQLLGSNAFVGFMQDTDASIVDRWRMAPTVEEREAAHAALQGLAELETVMRRAIAAKDIQESQDAKQPHTKPLA